jgi:FkbH-like protein
MDKDSDTAGTGVAMDSREIFKTFKSVLAGADAKTQVLPLLRSLRGTPHLEAAGNLLRREPLERLRELLGTGRNSEARIAIIGSSSLQTVGNRLAALLAGDAVAPLLWTGGYNQYRFEMLDGGSGLYGFRPDVTACLLDDKVLGFDPSQINSLSEFQDAVTDAVAQLEDAARVFAQHNRGILIFNTIPPNLVHADTLIDYRSKARLGRSWREFNLRLLELMDRHPQLIVIDTDTLLLRTKADYRDEKLNDYAGIAYTDEFMLEIESEIAKVVRAVKGKTRKCLVVDLDNTLWGGVVGEDTVNGIRLDISGDGKPFHNFQKVVKAMTRQGVLLAINSKNDLDLVEEVLRTHPGMALSRDDFLAVRANWRDKATNLREIAAQLNIGLDSMVFVDDQPFERDFVRHELPEVEVIDIGQDASDYARILAAQGFFNAIDLTEEDRQRGEKYRSEERRAELRASAGDYSSYLKGLEIRASLIMPEPASLQRLEQLEQRTNQFNMTTRRLKRAELETYAHDERYWLRAIEASDRFGRYGIVGSILVDKGDDRRTWTISNLILSCTILSRGIERGVLDHVLLLAGKAGITEVLAEYVETAKNKAHRRFYQDMGFVERSCRDGLTTFGISTDQFPEPATWITLTAA